MKDERATYDTAILAMEKGFWEPDMKFFNEGLSVYRKEGSIDPIHSNADGHSLLAKIATGKLKLPNGYTSEKTKEDYFKGKGYVLAPTQTLLQRWLREKHGIVVSVYQLVGEHAYSVIIKDSFGKKIKGRDGHHFSVMNNFEEALEEALKLIKEEEGKG